MCRKAHTAEMNEFLKYVSFRIDLFSLPRFKDEYVNWVANTFKTKDFAERILTLQERQIVDIDTIASSLGLPIEDIASKRAFVFKSIDVEGQKAKLYITPYFVCVRLVLEDSEVKDLEKQQIGTIASLFKNEAMDNLADIQDVFCMTSHFCRINREEIKEVLDTDAFPEIDPDTFDGINYSDSSIYDDIKINLNRIIICDRETDDRYPYNVFVSTTATPIANNTRSMNELLEMMYKMSLDESARCFLAK